MALQNRSLTHAERTTQLTHTAATTVLTPLLINSRVWIPLNTASANALNAYLWQGEISDAPTNAPEAWAAGDKIYWDNTNSRFTNVATSNTLCGHAIEPKASAATTSGLIFFNTFAA